MIITYARNDYNTSFIEISYYKKRGVCLCAGGAGVNKINTTEVLYFE